MSDPTQRQCRCGNVFEPLDEFDMVCVDCWHDAMQAGDDDDDSYEGME